jgi:ubiquinone/menaquinone biosynthesis C-methylase UbiE
MDAKLQLRVQRYGWDAAAAVYDDGWRENLAPAQEAVLKACDLQPGHKVVETAAGSGLATFPAAADISPNGEVIATDLSGEMVALGNAAVKNANLSNVNFARMNCEALDLPDDAFDRAFCSLGLMYVPNPQLALAEMKRVLKPGGRVSVVVWGERRRCGWAEIFPIVDARVNSEVCPMFFGLGAPGALNRDMQEVGFEGIEEQRLHSKLWYENEDQLLSAMIDGGAVAMAAKRFDPSTKAEVESEFLASVETWRVGDGFEIPGEFLIASGTA